MLTRSLIRLALVASATTLVGCSNPCEQLSDVACEAAGESSVECKNVRERADKASSADKRSCRVALELVESLSKAQ